MRSLKPLRRKPRVSQAHIAARLRVESLEERIVLTNDTFPLAGATVAPIQGRPPSGANSTTFFITKFADLTGTGAQQIAEANARLQEAGVTTAKADSWLGSEGLVLVRTTQAVNAASLNQTLAAVEGYQYVRTVAGNSATGDITRVFKGRLDRAVNPLLRLTQTRLDVGPLEPTPPPPGEPLTPPTLLDNFDGIDSDDNPFDVSPPDTIIAAGPNHVIEIVNVALRIYSKDGTVLSTQLLEDFFAPVGAGFTFDPLVTYDAAAGRWYIAAVDGLEDIMIAVSNTSNPLDGFTEMHRVPNSAPGDFADFPKIGFNADAVILEANAFGSGGGTPRITTISKATLLDANPATIAVFTSTPAPNFRAMVPATMHNATPGSDVMYFVQERSYGDGDFIQVVKMTGVLSNSPIYTYFDIDVDDYGFPPLAEQPGGLVNTNDTTFLNADWRNGKLVAAHSVGDPTDTESHAAWYLLDAPDSAAATPSLLQEGRLDIGPGISTYYPTVAITAAGAIGMTYMQSSPTQFPSVYVTGRSAADPVGEMREGALVALGEDFLEGFGRAGDYSGIVVDPADNSSFWAANEFKEVGKLWSTAIAHFSLGMSVANTTPANGAIVSTRPTEYLVDFSDPYDPTPAFINPAGVRINGNSATAYTLVDANTIRFTFTVDPVVTQGLQTFDVSANTVRRLTDGDPLQAYSGSFRYDVVRMQVVSSVPANGSVTTLPLTSITINLNEAYLPASVGTNDLTLSAGTVTGFTLVDADTITYQVAGITEEGTLTFSVPAGALTDAFGNPNQAYTASTTLDFGTVPFPVPTVKNSPLGSLISQTSKSGFILPAGDADSFTILVDTGQTITVIVEPADGFRSTVSLFATDGGDVLVGSATSAAAGTDAVIQPVVVPGSLTAPGAPRNYKVTVAGFGSSTGAYTVRLILNAAAEAEDHDGATNDTRPTAQSLDGSLVSLAGGGSTAARGAVIGNVRGGAQAGEAYVAVRSPAFFGGSVQRYDTAGNLVQTITHPVLEGGVISDVELGPNNVIYVGLATNFGGGVASGELAKFDLAGNYLGSVPLPDDNDFGFLYPFAFDVAPDGSVWVPQLNNGDIVHVADNGTVLGTFFISFNAPEDAAVRADGQVFLTQVFSSEILQLDPSTGDVTFFTDEFFGSAGLLNFTPSGDLWEGDFNGPLLFDAVGNFLNFIDNFGTVDPQVDPSGNLWVTNFAFATIQRFSPAGDQQFSIPTPGGSPIGVAVLGIDSPAPLPPVDNVDFYSFSLTSGQSATVVLDVLAGLGVSLELQDAAGNTIALGSASGPLDQVIGDFFATATGTYYLKVNGNGAEYSLTVTKNAAFDVGQNDSLATAQAIVVPVSGGRRVVLGHASGSTTAVLNATDSGWYTDFGQHDSGNDNYVTGQIVGFGTLRNFFTFSPGGLPDGSLTAAQFRAFNPSGGYVSTDPTETFALYDVTTPVSQLTAGGSNLTGIYNDLGTGIAYGSRSVSVADDGTVVTVDLNAAALADLSGKLSGPFALGGAITTLAGNPNDQVAFAFTGGPLTRQLALTLQDVDWYSVSVAAGGTLTLDTATPAGLAGQLVNQFDPIVYVYNAAGVLVASNDNGGADGRNALLTTSALAAGTYYIVVAPSPLTPNPTSGEYVLGIAGSVAALPPFSVTTTDPANGAQLRIPPTSITVNFNDSVLFSSVQASDLKLDGINATGVTIVDGNTLVFTLPGPLAEGNHVVTIAAGALTDLQGTLVSAYTGTFFLDFTGPRITGTSLAPGGIAAPGSLSYQVTFSEAMNAANLSTDDYLLYGVFRDTFYDTSSASFNGAGTVLTLNYTGLPDDNYIVVLFSGSSGGSNFTDAVGNALDGEFFGTFPTGDGVPGGDFFVDFNLDLVTEVYPGTPSSTAPRGGIVYQASADRVIAFAGDTDAFTVTVDPGQKITVVVDPALGDPAPTVEIRDPSNNLLGTATAGAGLNALIQAVSATGGTYTIIVGASAGSTGRYTLQVTLNAALEAESVTPPAPNNTLATAQNIDGSFVNLTTTLASATRGAVVGQTDSASYTATAVTFAFENISATGTRVLQGADDSTFSTALGFTFPFFGVNNTTVGFSSNGLITFGGTDGSFTNTDLTGSPALATIAPFWDDLHITGSDDSSVIFETRGTAPNRRFIVQWNDVSFFPGFDSNRITFQAVLSENGSIQFNYLDLSSSTFGNEGAGATVGVKGAGAQGPNRLLLAFNNGPNAFVGTGKSTLLSPPVPTPDYYAVTLTAGQTVTLGLAGLGNGNLNLELRNSADTVVATGVAGSTNLAKVISNFSITTSGTYYVRISGDANVRYDLVVTRNAAFDTEPNSTSATAQSISGTQGVLGHVNAGFIAALDNFDDGVLDGYTFLGANNASVTAAAAHDGPFGLQIASATEWFYRNDAQTAVARGDTISWWVQSAGAPTGRLYVGFGASASGTLSIVMAGNTGELLIQRNAGYGFENIGAVAQGWEANKWYRFEVAWDASGAITGRLFDTNGTTLLNTVTATDSTISAGGLAFRGFGPTYFVDTAQKGIEPNEDWYSFTLAAGQTVLNLETRTPADGPGVFANTLNPKIELYSPAGVLIASGTTLGDGRNESIQATGLAAGTYRVRVLAEGGTAGEFFVGVKALVTPTPTALVDNTNFGFSTRGAWAVVSGGYQGSYRRIAGNGDGSLYAQWQYAANFTAGTSYGFYVTWVAAPTNATNARYKVFDGAAQIGTVTLDQTRTPNSAFVNGAFWQLLFVYTAPTTGMHVIRVQVDNSGNGNVVADALFDPPLNLTSGGSALAPSLPRPTALTALDSAFSAPGKMLSQAPTTLPDAAWTLFSAVGQRSAGVRSSDPFAKRTELSAAPTSALDAAFALIDDRRTRFDRPTRSRRGAVSAPLAVDSSEETPEASAPGEVAVAEQEPRRD